MDGSPTILIAPRSSLNALCMHAAGLVVVVVTGYWYYCWLLPAPYSVLSLTLADN